MLTAWRLARKGRHRFGGTVRQYLAAALRLTWQQSRRVVSIVVATVVRAALDTELLQ